MNKPGYPVKALEEWLRGKEDDQYIPTPASKYIYDKRDKNMIYDSHAH